MTNKHKSLFEWVFRISMMMLVKIYLERFVKLKFFIPAAFCVELNRIAGFDTYVCRLTNGRPECVVSLSDFWCGYC